MKIVFLDSGIVNPGDLSWEPVKKLGEFEHYKQTSTDELKERMQGVDAVLIDAFCFDRERLESCPSLKFIGIAATGFNHVDLTAAKELGIAVANVPAYSTDAVAQQAISLLLAVTNRVDLYHQSVVTGNWRDSAEPTFLTTPITLLAGKSMGIIGYGNIGKRSGHGHECPCLQPGPGGSDQIRCDFAPLSADARNRKANRRILYQPHERRGHSDQYSKGRPGG